MNSANATPNFAQPKPALKPGSKEATQAGCTCPVLDNNHGAGYMGLGKVWVMRQDCPLHGEIAKAPPK